MFEAKQFPQALKIYMSSALHAHDIMHVCMYRFPLKKTRIRETPTILTDVDSSTDTIIYLIFLVI